MQDSGNTSETGQTSEWFEELDKDDRRVLLLLVAYERERRKIQYGYRAIKEQNITVVNSVMFKQAKTVVAWLDSMNYSVTWSRSTWCGYVKFVFESLAPKVPFIGQLKNVKLLRQYIRSGYKSEVEPIMTREELHKYYDSVLRPELRGNYPVQAVLGLRGTRVTSI